MSLLGTVQDVLGKAFGDTLIPGSTLTEPASFLKRTRGAFNVTTLAGGDTFAAGVSVRCFVTEISSKEIAQSGGLLRQGDRRARIQKSASVPLVEIGDRLTWQGDTYEIIDVQTPRLSETDLLFNCSIRK